MIELPANFFFTAHTTLRCNFSCSYCIQRHDEYDKNTMFNLSELSTTEFIDGLKNFKAPFLVISGGEVTIRNDAATIACGVADNFSYIEIGTNLNKDPSTMIKEIIQAGKKNIKIGCSFHPEQVKNETMFLLHLKKIMNSPIELNVVAIVDTPDHKGEEAYKKFQQMGVPKLQLSPYQGFWKGDLYPKEFEEYGGRHDKKKCNCSSTIVAISPNGNIYRCSHLLYLNSKHSMGNITNITTENEQAIKDNIINGGYCDELGWCQPCNVYRIFPKAL